MAKSVTKSDPIVRAASERKREFNFDGREIAALQPRYDAQKIAFGPIVFQCVRLAWKWHLLDSLAEANSDGLTAEALAEKCNISKYAADVLLESCLSAGIVLRDDRRKFVLSKSGWCVARDSLTQVNIDFVNDVCYAGMQELEQSLRLGKPLGLQSLGPWATLYDGLASFPEPARSSWLAFDHFYSDSAFPEALKIVFAEQPGSMLDIGANTGRWALECLKHDPDVQVALVDLPQQLEIAKAAVDGQALGHRVTTCAMDVTLAERTFPENFDAVWMSQFLVCFDLAEVERLLRRAASSLAQDGALYVLDTFWDNQEHEIAAYCVINASPYFAAIASGNSKMYSLTEIVDAGKKAGLTLDGVWERLGVSHTLLRFRSGVG